MQFQKFPIENDAGYDFLAYSIICDLIESARKVKIRSLGKLPDIRYMIIVLKYKLFSMWMFPLDLNQQGSLRPYGESI